MGLLNEETYKLILETVKKTEFGGIKLNFTEPSCEFYEKKLKGFNKLMAGLAEEDAKELKPKPGRNPWINRMLILFGTTCILSAGYFIWNSNANVDLAVTMKYMHRYYDYFSDIMYHRLLNFSENPVNPPIFVLDSQSGGRPAMVFTEPYFKDRLWLSLLKYQNQGVVTADLSNFYDVTGLRIYNNDELLTFKVIAKHDADILQDVWKDLVKKNAEVSKTNRNCLITAGVCAVCFVALAISKFW
jgi:hypothetical protein